MPKPHRAPIGGHADAQLAGELGVIVAQPPAATCIMRDHTEQLRQAYLEQRNIEREPERTVVINPRTGGRLSRSRDIS